MSGKPSENRPMQPDSAGSAKLFPYRLQILGGFSLTGPEDRDIAVSSKKNRALLGVLALSPRMTASRERITGILWSEFSSDAARNSLRQSLTTLRRDLAHDAILITHDDTITLNTELVSSDVMDLLEACETNTPEALRLADAAWRGELLTDVTLHEEGYEEWLRAERFRLRVIWVEVLQRRYELKHGRERLEVAVRLVEQDPLSEAAHRMLMCAYAEMGDRGMALKQFESCRAILHAQLGVEPDDATMALRNEIANPLDTSAITSKPSSPSRSPHIVDETIEGPSIAVLPFDNASVDPEQAFLSDGISEDIIVSLSRFRQLRVIARSSSFSLRGSARNMDEIAGSLGVRYVLHGSVRRSGPHLRVIAELRQAASPVTLWTERFDRSIEDVFSVIDSVSSAITALVIDKIEENILRSPRAAKPGRYAAYECVLRGRHLLHTGERMNKLAARVLFEEAIERDPAFALGHVYLALAHLHEFFFDDSGAALDKAADIAHHALSLDDHEPWCHMVLALTYPHRRQFSQALQHAERAVALNPSDPQLIGKLALVLIDVGRADDAIPLIRRAMALTPISPEDYTDYLALAFYGAHRYREAEDAMQMMSSDTFYFHVWMAAIAFRQGDLARAERYRAEALRLAPDFSISRFAKMEPIRFPDDLQHWTDALSAAGFPL